MDKLTIEGYRCKISYDGKWDEDGMFSFLISKEKCCESDKCHGCKGVDKVRVTIEDVEEQ